MPLSITDLKKNTIFEYNGEPFKVVDYKQKVMGRGGSIVNVRIKSLIDAKVLEKTFKGNEQLKSADVTTGSSQYLYKDHEKFYFMDQSSFENYEVSKDLIGDSEFYFKEGDTLQLQFFNSQVISVDLPKNIPLKITYTESVVKGDTSSSITKEAVTETGLKIKVPAFIKQGDIISVDTLNGTYRERIKE